MLARVTRAPALARLRFEAASKRRSPRCTPCLAVSEQTATPRIPRGRQGKGHRSTPSCEVMPRLAPRAALCAGALALYALLCAAAPSTAAPPVDALEEEQYFEGAEAGTCAPPGQPTRVQRLASLV